MATTHDYQSRYAQNLMSRTQSRECTSQSLRDKPHSRARAAILIALLLPLLFLCNGGSVSAQRFGPRDVFIEDLKLIVRGEEYFVKGVAYSPFPLGVKSMKKSGEGGGGFCSAKKTVFGEYLSACFGSDMFDGTDSDPERDPPGPRGGWWRAVWERDFEVMKRAGFNTLRIYNMNPLTKTFLANNPDEFEGVVAPEQGADHLPFLDYAFLSGFRVIVPVVSDESMLTNYGEARLKRIVEANVDELGNHPALLMWSVGNELNLAQRTDLRERVNMLMNYVRDYTQKRWKRRVPVMTVLLDKPGDYESLVNDLDVDLFVSNAGYRHLDFRPLWDGEKGTGFMGFKEICRRTGKPLLFGEIGMHDQDENTAKTPDWFNQQWKQVVDHVDDGCIGAVFFEYSDEPYTKPASESDMGIVKFAEATSSAGKSSTDPNVWIPDKVIEKNIVFDSVANGHPNSSLRRYNLNTEVTALIGREKYKSANYRPSDTDDFDPVNRRSNPGGDGRNGSNAVWRSGQGVLELMAISCTAAILLML